MCLATDIFTLSVKFWYEGVEWCGGEKISTSQPRCLVIVRCAQNAPVYQTSWPVVICNSRRMGEIKCPYCCWVQISLTDCSSLLLGRLCFILHLLSLHVNRGFPSLNVYTQNQTLIWANKRNLWFASSTLTSSSTIQLEL